MCRSILLLLVLLPIPAHAQRLRYQTEGLVLSFSAARVEQPARGLVVGTSLGMGVTRNFTVSFGFDIGGASVNDSTRMIGHADLLLRAYPFVFERVAPFADIAFSSQLVERPPEDLVHTGFTIGGGAEVFLSETKSVTAALRRSGFPEHPTWRAILALQLRPPRDR